MNYPYPSTWMTVQMDPRPEPEPELVRANPSCWPPLMVPADWPEERIRRYAKWGEVETFASTFGSNLLVNHHG